MRSDRFVTGKMSYYPNNAIKEKWEVYTDDPYSGRYSLFNENGVVVKEHWYKNNANKGPSIRYHSNGVVSDYMVYENDSVIAGGVYLADSLGNISQYFHYRDGKPAFILDYVDTLISSNLESVFFEVASSWEVIGDSGYYQSDIFVVTPPISDVQISYLEFGKDNSEVRRMALSMQSGAYQFDRPFAWEDGLHIALEYIIYDANYPLRDTIIKHIVIDPFTFHDSQPIEY